MIHLRVQNHKMQFFRPNTLALGCFWLCSAAYAAEPDDVPLGFAGKASFHLQKVVNPEFAPLIAARAGVLQWHDSPHEWGQGAGAYGKRAASAAGGTAIRNTFALALDSTLREDPRYRRIGEGGVFARVAHAIRETFLTRTDSGRVRFATWRFGSAIGAAFLTNVWYPDRVNTVSSGLEDAATSIGGDVLVNVGNEFWPDLRRKLFRR